MTFRGMEVRRVVVQTQGAAAGCFGLVLLRVND